MLIVKRENIGSREEKIVMSHHQKEILMLLGVPGREENKGVIHFCTHLQG